MSDWILTDGSRTILLGESTSGVGLERPPEIATVDIETDDVSLPRAVSRLWKRVQA